MRETKNEYLHMSKNEYLHENNQNLNKNGVWQQWRRKWRLHWRN